MNPILDPTVRPLRWALGLVALAAAGAAFAAPPANLAGTTWTVQVNRDSEQLVIDTQAGPGAPGSNFCRPIHGTIGIAPVRGWYCPANGRIRFLHENSSTRLAMRSFEGYVSDEVIGQRLYMAGTMAIHYSTFGPFGEYNFSAVK
jgi:hypothetical protein